MKISRAIPIALLLLCFFSISWAKPQQPTDPPKVIKKIPRHDELRAKPDYQLADDWNLIRVRRESQTPILGASSKVVLDVDDPVVKEAAMFFVMDQEHGLRPPFEIQLAEKRVPDYVIRLLARKQSDDNTKLCWIQIKVVHEPGQNTEFQTKASLCLG